MGNKSVKEAIDAAGGSSKVASWFGIEPASVSGWIKRGIVPAEHCPTIEKNSNGAALCEELNSKADWGYFRTANSTEPAAEAAP